MDNRELTRAERAAIKKLVIGECAHYDYMEGCIPLACECYMLNKWWTGSYCLYFQKSVLPLDPMLEAALVGGDVETRPCAACGQPFPVSGKKAYCSVACEKNALRRQKREYMRKKRGERGNLLL